MSLEFVYENDFSLKKTRHRACDICRRMKRRCDGKLVCCHCAKYGVSCTYVEPAEPRARPPRRAREPDPPLDSQYKDYIETLQQRLKIAEASLRQQHQLRPPPLVTTAIKRLSRPFTAAHPEDSVFADIAESFRALSLDGVPADPGFQGKSSAAMLVKVAVSAKPGPASQRPQQRIDHPNAATPRPWTLKSWESPSVTPHHDLIFPWDNLLPSLVSLYFSNVNVFLPLLQRHRFQQCIDRQLHLHHYGFASTLLLVSALGSLYVDYLSTQDRLKMAWHWYNQVELCGHSLRQQPGLHDLQTYCLAAQFLYGTSNPRFCWSIVGFGLRLVEDIGAHRHSAPRPHLAHEKELEKRAVWILLIFDTQLSGVLGRGPAMKHRDIDILLPTEFDAEDRESPSMVKYFIALITLHRILQFTLSTLYSSPLEKRAMALTDPNAVAAELDSALDSWFTNVPPHLVWDADRLDTPSFAQAAALACLYHCTRILIHRPTITSAPLDPRALDICTRSAYACIRITDAHRRRKPAQPLVFSQSAVFTAGMVLILSLRGARSATPNDMDVNANATSTNIGDTDATHTQRASIILVGVRTAVDVLEAQQQRWPASSFSVTVLERLLSLDPHAGNTLDGEEEEATVLRSADEPIPGQLWVEHLTKGGMQQQQEIPPTVVGDEDIAPGTFYPFVFPNV
ncbi:fungal-specific transcription factor domain-containing protein [Mycena capillaripes]|nr:fungal-specific transcription factor domain-containing protein [Mycena capillaripes]